ncbi:ester cyclase [Streptomyces sp. NPDC090088]|uniref:ester cyclase n=1 Tax=Streptomyces sp. NPDC090088 TaxID=3365944 RepID=UPI0037F1B47F
MSSNEQSDIERNKTVARRYFEEFVDGRRLDVLEEIVAVDAADETRVGPGGTGTRDDFRLHAQSVWDNVKDLKITVTDLVAEADRVIVFWRIQGIQAGTLFGVPASGRAFTGHSISTLTIRDGQVVRYTVLPDRLGIIQQLSDSRL